MASSCDWAMREILMALCFVPPKHWTAPDVCGAIGHVWCLVFGLVACCDRCWAAVLLGGG